MKRQQHATGSIDSYFHKVRVEEGIELKAQQNVVNSQSNSTCEVETELNVTLTTSTTKSQSLLSQRLSEAGDTAEVNSTNEVLNRRINFNTKWPDIWTEKQRKEFTDRYDWLIAENGKLGKLFCSFY